MPTPRGAWRKPWCKAPAPRSAACGALWRGGAAALAGRGAAAGVGLPAALAPYVEKVARHAYLVTGRRCRGPAGRRLLGGRDFRDHAQRGAGCGDAAARAWVRRPGRRLMRLRVVERA